MLQPSSVLTSGVAVMGVVVFNSLPVNVFAFRGAKGRVMDRHRHNDDAGAQAAGDSDSAMPRNAGKMRESPDSLRRARVKVCSIFRRARSGKPGSQGTHFCCLWMHQRRGDCLRFGEPGEMSERNKELVRHVIEQP